MSTQESTPTSYITASDGIRYAYRLLNPSSLSASSSSSALSSPSSTSPIPLVMHIHFRANMDFWDPALINPLARRRPVLLFDQAGVGRSGGAVAGTYAGWADGVIALVQALGFARVDLCGFSMGGRCVQMVALRRPGLVRRLVLAGTDASAPAPSFSPSPSPTAREDPGERKGMVWPREQAPAGPIRRLSKAETGDRAEMEAAIAASFFPDSRAGKAAADAYFARIATRRSSAAEEAPLLSLLGKEASRTQRKAAVEWATYNPENSFDRLAELTMPVLVVNGDNDLLIPTSLSWECARMIPNAKLIIYPQAGHGFLWQYAERVAQDINAFLDDPVTSRL